MPKQKFDFAPVIVDYFGQLNDQFQEIVDGVNRKVQAFDVQTQQQIFYTASQMQVEFNRLYLFLNQVPATVPPADDHECGPEEAPL